jgi:hypothetical protein
MEHPGNLHVTASPEPALIAAIDRWLAARAEYKEQASDQNQNAYNAAYFALGEAWVVRYPEVANMSGGFEQFRCSLIAPETDE